MSCIRTPKLIKNDTNWCSLRLCRNCIVSRNMDIFKKHIVVKLIKIKNL